MAQLNITLNQEEIQALLLEDSGEGFKKIGSITFFCGMSKVDN